MNRKTAFIAACAGMFLFGITLITLGSVATDLKLKNKILVTAKTIFRPRNDYSIFDISFFKNRLWILITQIFVTIQANQSGF